MRIDLNIVLGHLE